MPSFSQDFFLFVLALLLFGPKKLPVLARELGKWMGEFRRASNEFKMQMNEELRLSEQADRQKQISAMEAAAPVAPAIAEPEHPHLPAPEAPSTEIPPIETIGIDAPATSAEQPPAAPLPIATSGELNLMPPSTGLPVAQNPTPAQNPIQDRSSDAVSSLLSSIPFVSADDADRAETVEPATEAAVHGR